jgi:hypothetical protein
MSTGGSGARVLAAASAVGAYARRPPKMAIRRCGLSLVPLFALTHFLVEVIREPDRHAEEEDNHENAEQTVITRKQQIPSHSLPFFIN